MSSIIENQKLLFEKRSFFMRSGSFEKLKCSAKYPFRLVGVKLSKASAVELAETIIAKSRLLSQRLLIVLFIVIYKALCTAVSILVHTSANPMPLSLIGVCDKNDKTTTKLGFYERLQIKVEKLQRHKKRLDTLKGSEEISTFLTTDTTDEGDKLIRTIEEKCIAQANRQILDTADTTISNNTIAHKDEFHAELKRLREYSVEKEYSNIDIGDVNKNLLEIILLYPLVYGSILLMICQIFVLGNVLNSTQITMGFAFLVGSLGVIAYILFKVFFIEKFRKVKVITKKTCELKMTDEQKIVVTEQDTNYINSSIKETTNTTTEIASKRQSRSRLKRNIDLNSTTLSKIKLL